MNKKQEWSKALILLCVGIVIATMAYSYRDQLLGVKTVNRTLFKDVAYSYIPCEIYSSIPGEYFVKMKFLIPGDDRKHEISIHKNMVRIKDFIFSNVSSDTELGHHLEKLNFAEIKSLLIDQINENLSKPVKNIYFQECLVMNSHS